VTTAALETGAELRITGDVSECAVVCVNGGAAPVPGTWSASLEWLVRRLARRRPGVGFVEVRYRVKSWRELDSCAADARAAVRAVGAPHTQLLGFSMGGAVAILAADQPSVERVIGLAPWIPDRLPLETLQGRRLDVLHGSLDRYFPASRPSSPAAASSARGRSAWKGRTS
jgi:pimeloyl-ACP methyl ester carboxylesterase